MRMWFWSLVAIGGTPVLASLSFLVTGLPAEHFTCNDAFYRTLVSECAMTYSADLFTLIAVIAWWLFCASIPVVLKAKRGAGGGPNTDQASLPVGTLSPAGRQTDRRASPGPSRSAARPCRAGHRRMSG